MAQFVMMKEERHRTVRREVQREFHWDQEHYPITFHDDDDDDDEKPYNKYNNNNNNNNYVEQCYWNPCHITYSNQMKPRVETRVVAPPKVISTVHHQYHQQRPTHMGRSRIIQHQLPNHQLITMKNNPALSSAPPAPKIMTCDEVAQLYGGVVFNTVWAFMYIGDAHQYLGPWQGIVQANCPRQPKSQECGFYVLKYMTDIVARANPNRYIEDQKAFGGKKQYDPKTEILPLQRKWIEQLMAVIHGDD